MMLALLSRASTTAVRSLTVSPFQTSVCRLHVAIPVTFNHSIDKRSASSMTLSRPDTVSQHFQVNLCPHHRLCNVQIRSASSGSNFTDQGPTQTHVFRIKSKIPVVPKPSLFKSFFSVPAPYLIYGLGGLIPFMSAPYYMHVVNEFNPTLAHAQLIYGACILSFLGGVSWGNHLRKDTLATLTSLRYSILLPLVAWPAVLMFPHPASFGTMIGGVVYAGWKDVRSADYPSWFKSLRFLLSSLVALSLTTTLIFSYTKNIRTPERGGDNEKECSKTE